jgi:hypothetical protein
MSVLVDSPHRSQAPQPPGSDSVLCICWLLIIQHFDDGLSVVSRCLTPQVVGPAGGSVV